MGFNHLSDTLIELSPAAHAELTAKMRAAGYPEPMFVGDEIHTAGTAMRIVPAQDVTPANADPLNTWHILTVNGTQP